MPRIVFCHRGQLLSDVWLLDIFDWRQVHRPASGGTVAAATAAASVGVSTSTLAGEVSSVGARAVEATEASNISLCWVCLDLSASPLKPPGRFLHSCSVFFKTTGDGSCCIVRIIFAFRAVTAVGIAGLGFTVSSRTETTSVGACLQWCLLLLQFPCVNCGALLLLLPQVVAGGWTSIVLPRARLYALHRDAKGHWRHVSLSNGGDRWQTQKLAK